MAGVPAESDGQARVEYLEESRKLRVRFRGCLYEYYGVPRAAYDGLLAAASRVEYFHRHIKGQYGCRRI